MSKLIKIGAALALSVSVSFGASQADFDAVKAHVEKGVQFCKDKGLSVCLEEFNKKESQWVKGDLYIWANDFNGIITAHPKKPIKGKNLYKYKDTEGTQLFKEFIDKVKADGSGWVDYVWSHPKTNKQTPKTSYVKGIGGDQLIGAGIYK